MSLLKTLYYYIERSVKDVFHEYLNMGHMQSLITSSQLREQAHQLKATTLLSHADFLKSIKVLNEICDGLQDHKGKRMIFCVKKGTDEMLLWKALVRVQCFTVSSTTGSVQSIHLINLKQFIHLYDELTKYLQTKNNESENHPDTADQSEASSSHPITYTDMTTSTLIKKVSRKHSGSEKEEEVEKEEEDKNMKATTATTSTTTESSTTPMTATTSTTTATSSPEATETAHISSNEFESCDDECIICMNARPQILLPCSHAYCEACIDKWQKLQQECPVCRTVVRRADEGWVLESAEVHDSGMQYLMSLLQQGHYDDDDDDDDDDNAVAAFMRETEEEEDDHDTD